ncbi:TPA: hypothetical protein JAN86_14800 [Legionella pneumophila]|nr:hypothetical protein [Legionella pneumophila]
MFIIGKLMSKEQIKKTALEIVKYIHDNIKACNIPNQKKENKFFAPLVYLCQTECDKILSNTKISLLERLLKCAKIIDDLQSGNCMQQAFLAFQRLLMQLVEDKLSDFSTCIPISIMTISNHAFLIIDNDIVCDPWLNFVEDLRDYCFAKMNRKEYFGIRSDWTCFTDTEIYDEDSTEFTIQFVNALGVGISGFSEVKLANQLMQSSTMASDHVEDPVISIPKEFHRI